MCQQKQVLTNNEVMTQYKGDVAIYEMTEDGWFSCITSQNDGDWYVFTSERCPTRTAALEAARLWLEERGFTHPVTTDLPKPQRSL